MFEILLLDLDETILDFRKAESIAVSKTLRHMGVDPVTDETVALYSHYNKLHWEMLERGEITRQQVKEGRFAALFNHLGFAGDPKATTAYYEKMLAIGHYFLPGAREALDVLGMNHRLFLVSNGTATVQAGRLTSAGLYPLFEKVFVSEELGANKPDILFFDRCFAQIPNFSREKVLIIGDSLTSDILGGNRAGIATCWINAYGAQRREEVHVDFEVKSLAEAAEFLPNWEKDL